MEGRGSAEGEFEMERVPSPWHNATVYAKLLVRATFALGGQGHAPAGVGSPGLGISAGS